MKNLFNHKEIWALLEKILKSISSMIVIFIVSKNISESLFGLYSLIEVVLSIAIIISSAGTEQVFNKLFSDYGDIRKETIKYRFIFSIVSAVGAVFYFNYKFYINSDVVLAIVLFLLISPFAIYEQYLYAKGRYILVYKIKIICIVISILIRLTCFYSDNIILLLVISYFLETIPSCFLCFYKFTHKSEVLPSEMSNNIYKLFIQYSLPVMVASLSIIIYAKIDQFMISELIGLDSVAKYSILVRISDSFVFIPVAISVLYLPRAYLRGFSFDFIINYFRLILLLSFLSIFSSIFIYYIYSNYSNVNLLVSWRDVFLYQISILFNFIGVAISQYQIYCGSAVKRMVRILSGLLFNIALNYFLIPIYGISGAIVSTLISLFISNIIMVLVSSERYLVKYIIKSLVTIFKINFKVFNDENRHV